MQIFWGVREVYHGIVQVENAQNKSKTIQWKKLRNCDVIEDN